MALLLSSVNSLLVPPPPPACCIHYYSSLLPCKLPPRLFSTPQWPTPNRAACRKVVVVRVVSSSLTPDPSSLSLISENVGGGGYSTSSYYTSLALFVISVPGLWSLIKRSVKSKIVKKTFIDGGEGEGKKAANQMAGEILSLFTRNGFVVLDKGETIT